MGIGSQKETLSVKIILGLVSVFALSFAGCGKNKDSSQSANPASSQSQKTATAEANSLQSNEACPNPIPLQMAATVTEGRQIWDNESRGQYVLKNIRFYRHTKNNGNFGNDIEINTSNPENSRMNLICSTYNSSTVEIKEQRMQPPYAINSYNGNYTKELKVEFTMNYVLTGQNFELVNVSSSNVASADVSYLNRNGEREVRYSSQNRQNGFYFSHRLYKVDSNTIEVRMVKEFITGSGSNITTTGDQDFLALTYEFKGR